MCFLYRVNSSPRHLLGGFLYKPSPAKDTATFWTWLPRLACALTAPCSASIPALDCGIAGGLARPLHTLAAFLPAAHGRFVSRWVPKRHCAEGISKLALPRHRARIGFGPRPFPFRDICFAPATPVCGRSAQRVVHPPVMCRRGAAVPPPRPRAQRLSPWLRCGAATCFPTPFAASWRLQAPWARSAHPFFDLPER